MANDNDAAIDKARVIRAAKMILDGRSYDEAAVLVTLEHLIALMLLMHMDRNPRAAAGMLTEGLVDGVLMRLGMYEKFGLGEAREGK